MIENEKYQVRICINRNILLGRRKKKAFFFLFKFTDKIFECNACCWKNVIDLFASIFN